MLIKRATLEAIACGEVSLAFRRWQRPTVKAGGTLRTVVGVLSIGAVQPIEESALTETEAHLAGFDSVAALRASLRNCKPGTLYRIELSLQGEDPRTVLREQAAIAPPEFAAIRARLESLDGSAATPWTLPVLELIREHPRVRASELAVKMAVEPGWLKNQMRKLKEMGLTESLMPGYRLSPRGEAVLTELQREASR